jgi:uncharacterized repeat protein (TIGR01451 family)
VLTAAALLSSAMVVTATGSAPAALAAPARYSAPQASGTVLFNQPFHDNTVDGSAGSVSVPTSTASGAANSACLTASGNSTANPLASCPSPNDIQGSGTLRLTPDAGSKVGGIFASTSVPTSQGLDATFNTYQYGTLSPTGADGIAFVLGATDPANPSTPTLIGPTGGALGYSSETQTSPTESGLPDAYMGIGIDAYGNFSNHTYEGTGCTNPSNINTAMPGQVVIRGPGNGTVGYCAVNSSATTSTSQALTLTGSTRSGSLIPVEVVINPTSSMLTTASGLSVPAGDYDVTFTPIGGPAKSLVGALPTVPSGLYPSSWVNSAGIPKQLVFGWVASTGAVLDYHEINNAVVTSLAPVPNLAISETSYAASAPTKGSPVTYVVSASSSGATENQPVTVTQTMPSGVLPVSAYGTGWTCGPPSGQQISCTSTGSPFTSGTITINGVATVTTLTSATIASGSTGAISSSDGSPATATATAGTLPSAPVVTSISPTNGAAGGGNSATITGSNLSGATAVEIGTGSEFNAGTPLTLVLCSSPAPGCFTITNSTTIAISSMPAHAATTVQVVVVSLGVSSGVINYTYNTGPALLFASPPGGEVGVSYSDSLTVTGGTSPFTWSISAGSLPPGITIGTSTGLLTGTPTTAGTYSFTVKVTDSAGLSATEATSITIVPGPSLTFSTPPSGWTNTVYTDTLTATGGTTPYIFSLATGSLPPGISLSASGVLSGTPTSAGTYSFTVKLTDALGQTTTKATTLTIAAGVTTNFAAPPSGSVGIAYSYTLTATGGTTPYTWSVNAGTLPPGITLSSAGVLSGTPTTIGSYPFTVNVVDANGGVSTASITLVITGAPVLTINSTASVSTTTPGSVVTYTITATNAGAVAYTGATFTDSLAGLLADATYNSNATTTSGSLSYSSPNLTWTGSLAVGAVATITFSVTVNNPDTGTKVLSSTVTSTTTGSNCASGSTDSRCSVSVTVLVPGLMMSVSAASGTATPGSVVSYTVTVTNSGQTAYTGATFTASLSSALDDATYNGNATASTGIVSYTSPNLTWTGNLAVGATATITFSMTVNNPDTGDKVLIVTMTSTTSGSNCASGSTDSRCTTSVSVLVPGLTIVASAGSGTTTPGAVVSYTITVTNSGQTAYTGATLRDSLSDVLDDATYNANGSATVGTVSYSSPSLTWTGNLAVGASATITFSVTVSNPDTGNHILAFTVTSTTAGSNCASGSTDPRCSVSVPVAQLTIVVGANVSFATPGSVVRFTSTFTNNGQTPYTGITITNSGANTFANATPNGDQTATSGTIVVTTAGVVWTGSIPVGGTVTITGTVTVDNPDTGNKLLGGTFITTAPGSNCPSGSTDPRCTVSLPVLTPGLSVTQAASTSAAVPGQKVTFTVTIADSGQTSYSGISVADSISGSLGDASYDNDASVTSGSVGYASGVVTWMGSLAAGASAVLTYSVTVNNPDSGGKLLVSALTSAATGSSCPTSTSAGCTLTVAVLTPGLIISKTASTSTAVPGQVITYTITVTDSGQTPYTGAAFTDSLSDVIDDAAYNNNASATAGMVSYSSPNLTWTGNLAVGGSATITYTVTVSNPDTGNMILANTVTSTTPGSNCPSGGADPRCSVTVPVVNSATLTFTSATNVSAAAQGGVVAYTVTVANSGLSAYSGAAFTLPLAGVLDDASYDGDAHATAGTASFASPNLTWTGTVPASGTVTVTFSVTVNNPDTGNMILASTLTSASAGNNCAPASTDPRCSSTVTVAELTIVTGANVSFATPGSVVRFTTTITNNGQTPYTGITLTNSAANTFANATPNGDQTATSGTIVVTTAGVQWTGSVPVGGTVTITGTVTVDNPDTGNKLLGGTFITTALGSNCPAGGTDPRCTVSLPVLTPALTISQAANTRTAVPGQVIGFTVTITNTGQTPYTGTTATDSLAEMFDDATYNGDAAATVGTVSYTSPNVTWTGNLAVGATVTITFSVTVNNPDTGDKQVIVTVSSPATGSTCPPGTTASPCRTDVSVLTPALTITNSGSPTPAVAGGTVSYTITITNTGQTPYTGVTVTDDLTGVIDDAVYNNNASATAGMVSYSSPDLTWTGSLAPTASATITFSVTVDNPDTDGHILVSTVTSNAAGSNCAAGSTDPRCGVTIDVAELDITNIANVSTTIPGSVVDYTVTITNSGQTSYTGTSVTDDLTGVFDDATYDNDANTTAGSVTYISPDLTWTGSLAPGAAAVITFSVTVNNPDTGNRQLLSTTATTSVIGSDCPSSSPAPACTSTVTVLIPVLTITKTASSGTTTPGSVVSYTITVADTGPTPYTGATVTDDLSGLLTDAAYTGGAVASAGTVTYSSPTLTWTGDLAIGATATITYNVTVNNPDTGDKVLVNTVASTAIGSTCPPDATNSACTATVDDLIPGLTITKTANASTTTPGSVLGYTITVTDSGQTSYSPATLTDDLSGVLGDSTYNNDATVSTGTVSYATPTLTWIANLTPGTTATLTYSVTVNDADLGDHTLANTVASSDPGSTCPTDSTNAACSVTIPIVPGSLSILAPGSAALGSTAAGTALSGTLGTVEVIDDRGFGADWTATVSSTNFTTGNGAGPRTVPAADARYLISALNQDTGPAAFSFVPSITLSGNPQAVVSATDVDGNTTATWIPVIDVQVPASAIGGTYTAVITNSVS